MISVARVMLIVVMVCTSMPCLVFASDEGVFRFYLNLLEDAHQRSTLVEEWIEQLPGSSDNILQLKDVVKAMGGLKEKVPPIFLDFQNTEIQWQDKGAHSRTSLKLVSLKPLRFRFNGNEGVVEIANPTALQLYDVLVSTSPKHSVEWLWNKLVPGADAKSKSLLKKLMIPLIVLNVIGLAYAGIEIKKTFDKVDELEKRYKSDSKEIVPVLQKVTQNREKNPDIYKVTGADCKKTVGNARLNPLANPGEKGYQYYGLNNIRLTPKGKNFGENDLEITYANKDGIQEISEIRVRRLPNSKDSKNFMENDCLMYAASIKTPEHRFLKGCADKYFPEMNVNSMESFYKGLMPFDLKDHETLAKKEPGCQHILAWAAGMPSLAPKVSEPDSEPSTQAK